MVYWALPSGVVTPGVVAASPPGVVLLFESCVDEFEQAVRARLKASAAAMLTAKRRDFMASPWLHGRAGRPPGAYHNNLAINY